MRENKYRAWDKIAKPNRMKSWEQLLAQYQLTLVFTSKDFELMQSTELKDKNEKEIYEGDIVRAEHENYSDLEDEPKYSPWIGAVKFIKGAYSIETGRGYNPYLTNIRIKSIEVIGNIYENPELLESEVTNGVDRCTMCGEAIPEGNQACWRCKARIDKCNVCKNKEKGMCLAKCRHWRYKKYETKKM